MIYKTCLEDPQELQRILYNQYLDKYGDADMIIVRIVEVK